MLWQYKNVRCATVVLEISWYLRVPPKQCGFCLSTLSFVTLVVAYVLGVSRETLSRCTAVHPVNKQMWKYSYEHLLRKKRPANERTQQSNFVKTTRTAPLCSCKETLISSSCQLGRGKETDFVVTLELSFL